MSLQTDVIPEPNQELLMQLGSQMAKVQGYRLLDGFPRPHLMLEADEEADPGDRWSERPSLMDKDSELIVCVLPHSMCNPRVEACGFCTFPHEKLVMSQLRATVPIVAEEIRRRVELMGIKGHEVHALYFGGSTANLTPPDLFSHLVTTLEDNFELRRSEVSLEGVPVYFIGRRGLEVLDRLMATEFAHRRISMGIQTFNAAEIEEMGRSHFGDESTVRKAVYEAHQRGMTVSGDIIINRPGQTQDQMLNDVRKAIQIGLDQICIYNLVLRSYLKTPWSQDPEKLASLPVGEEAFQNWRSVVEILNHAGYVQTTLSNFERRDVLEAGRGFRYEEAGFQTWRYDALGFGPRALTIFKGSGRSIPSQKWMNHYGAEPYMNNQLRATENQIPYDKHHAYESREDLLLHHMTRSLALLQVDRHLMMSLTGRDPVRVYRQKMEVLEHAGLVKITDEEIRLTHRGAFFSDSIIALLTMRRERTLKADNADARHRRKYGWAFSSDYSYGGGGM